MTEQSRVVLVVDDDPSLRSAVEFMMAQMGCTCVKARDGKEALALFRRTKPDLVILDVMMPGIDGFSVCRSIRAMDGQTPLLFLSAKGDIVDKRMGFHLGADDWLVKPFSGEELQLRVAALLRRADAAAGVSGSGREAFAVGELTVNLHAGDVRLRGSKIDLTPKEFRIVALLAEHPGETFSKEEIIARVWGDEYLDTAISISTYIRRIREKIERDPGNPRYIQTVWRSGYRMSVE